MSYRTYIEDVQVFGNNEYYHQWIEFIQNQGVDVDEDGCYNGEIKDFMGALTVIENIVFELNDRHERIKEEYNGAIGKHEIVSLFDFTSNIKRLKLQPKDDKYNNSLLDELLSIIDSSYAFIPYVFYTACKDKLEPDKVFSTSGHFHCFKLKEGESIHIEAH